MTQIAVTNRKRLSRPIPKWVYGIGVFLVFGLVLTLFLIGKPSGFGSSIPTSLTTVPVKKGVFESRVVVRGDLQAVDNIDIVCQVEGASTITELAPEGSFVKKGDILVVLDSSTIRQRLEDTLIEWQTRQGRCDDRRGDAGDPEKPKRRPISKPPRWLCNLHRSK
ncbi:MAG: hypothetical protein KatS3mg104_2398 [Phycisphaerae bacterium]|nr:MAG: hypothetical protein KatS3mg104_2398 [Phycisphaerae bacterium]